MRMNNETGEDSIGTLPLVVDDAVRLVRECAEELGDRVAGLGRTALLQLLRRTLREGVAAVEASEQTVDFETAAWASVAARSARRPTTCRDLRTYVRRMLRIEGLSERPLRTMGSRECRELLHRAFGSSKHSYRKGRAILHSIFHYGQQQEWCGGNPVEHIPAPLLHERPIMPLSPDEVARLEQTVKEPAHREMELSLHLMTYCGLRPNEVQRLAPGDINWSEKEVIIRPSTSKTGGGRVVPLRRVGKIRRGLHLIPANWQRRWQKLRQAAGFRNWQADALRHTFASYHAAYYRNLPELQLEMGHRDCSLLRSRYLQPVSRQHAALFWSG